MGYRHYFYSMDKTLADKALNMNLEEYKKQFTVDGWFDWRNYFHELFEFEKLYWCDTIERINKLSSPLFLNSEVRRNHEDVFPVIVSKEGLKETIKIYHEKAIAGLKTDDNKKLIESIIKLFEEERIVDLENPERITHDWNYFYIFRVFDLVHLYRTFDWNNKTLIFMGW